MWEVDGVGLSGLYPAVKRRDNTHPDLLRAPTAAGRATVQVHAGKRSLLCRSPARFQGETAPAPAGAGPRSGGLESGDRRRPIALPPPTARPRGCPGPERAGRCF